MRFSTQSLRAKFTLLQPRNESSESMFLLLMFLLPLMRNRCPEIEDHAAHIFSRIWSLDCVIHLCDPSMVWPIMVWSIRDRSVNMPLPARSPEGMASQGFCFALQITCKSQVASANRLRWPGLAPLGTMARRLPVGQKGSSTS
jgi:hypothetical protein